MLLSSLYALPVLFPWLEMPSLLGPLWPDGHVLRSVTASRRTPRRLPFQASCLNPLNAGFFFKELNETTCT